MDQKKLGLLFGGIIGDSYGARYEFKSSDNVIKQLKEDKNQTKLLGGGHWRITPGQVTDDSEMALALLSSMCDNNGIYDQSKTVDKYIKWHKSCPFDEGITTQRAFDEAETLKDVLRNSRRYNYSSLSNGCLMRIWSLMYYYHSKSDDEIIVAATRDCEITHPNKMCCYIVTAYCLMLKLAMRDKTESKNDIIKVLDLYDDPVIKSIKNVVTLNLNYIILQNDEKEKVVLNRSGGYMGYIGLSFAIVLKEFLIHDNFVDYLAGISSYGGDTDTNCCIGSALFGAFYGIKKIPENYIKQVMRVNCKRYQKYPLSDISHFLSLARVRKVMKTIKP